MKRAVILLVSLAFIIFASAMILDNMKSSEKLLKSSNEDFVNTQAMILAKSYQEQIGKLLYNNRNDLDDIISSELSNEAIQTGTEEITVSIKLKKLDNLYNINDMFSTEGSKEQQLIDFLTQASVNYGEFKTFTQNYLSNIDEKLPSFSSSKQVLDLLEAYQNEQQLYYEEDLKNGLTFLDFGDNKQYVSCSLNLEVYNRTFKTFFIYDMQSVQNGVIGVVDFEFIF